MKGITLPSPLPSVPYIKATQHICGPKAHSTWPQMAPGGILSSLSSNPLSLSCLLDFVPVLLLPGIHVPFLCLSSSSLPIWGLYGSCLSDEPGLASPAWRVLCLPRVPASLPRSLTFALSLDPPRPQGQPQRFCSLVSFESAGVSYGFSFCPARSWGTRFTSDDPHLRQPSAQLNVADDGQGGVGGGGQCQVQTVFCGCTVNTC